MKKTTAPSAGRNVPSQTLPLGAKHVVLHRLVLLRSEPPYPLAVLVADAAAPREIVIDLDEVVVSQDGALGLHTAEEVQHAFLQLGFEARDVAAGVDLTERHPELVRQPPEARE
jgi:hypothetical protein